MDSDYARDFYKKDHLQAIILYWQLCWFLEGTITTSCNIIYYGALYIVMDEAIKEVEVKGFVWRA